MFKVILTVGIPGSGKSTWAKSEVAKDPNNWARINNDDIRAMLNGSVWSSDYEKFITETRNYLIREALKRKKNVIIDNLNLNPRHFDDVCKIVKSVNISAQVFEKPFFIELDEAIERDSKREGKAKVGEDVIKKWWKESGKTTFKFYKPRVEVFTENVVHSSSIQIPYDPKLPNAIICDLDGTAALLNGRSPYDASTCEDDLPNVPVIETLKLYYQAGYKIIFCSGREDKFGQQTKNFLDKHLLVEPKIDYPETLTKEPELEVIKYKLYMRKTDDFRKDSIIKEEMYEEHIKGKYNVLMVLDDRDQVVEFWRSKGLVCFQVAPGAF
jgi:predicted kinase